jgi:RND family efflux transporter MFP subunit
MQTHQETTQVETTATTALPRTRRWLGPVLLVALTATLGGLLLTGVIPRRAQLRALTVAASESTRVYSVARAAAADATTEIVLPSSVEASQETPLYPRVNGYVKRIAVDIGSQVKAGDVLAEIETPELDQQVTQAKAAQEQANANLRLAEVSYGRWRDMQNSKIVAPQEVDERKGALDARKADLNAAEANVQRLEQTRGFQNITAPFDGTITKRFVEVGQLVTGDLNDSTRILFRLEHTSALRAFVNVPQFFYRSVKIGQAVALSFKEVPGRAFTGKVVRTAGALDNTTRTLRVEVQVPNESAELIPGLYAEVRFTVRRDTPPLAVPARALITQAAGPQIATLDEANRVTLRSVSIERDLGKTLELASGLEVNARYIANPTDTLRDGMIVRVDGAEPAKLAQR